MKIAHLIPQFYPYLGGAEICVHNICATLAEQGHEAYVITTTPKPEEKLSVHYNIIHISRKTCGMFRRIPFIGKIYLNMMLARLQKKYKFDLWQVTMGYPLGLYAVDFFRKNNIPCILRCCGEDIQVYPEINYGYRLDKAIDGMVTDKFPLYDGLVALTPSVKEEYLKIGIDGKKIKIISNGVDNKRFKKCDEAKCEAVRNSFGIVPGSGKIMLLTVGRYHPKKGFDLIPGIAAELRKKGLDFVWVIAGKKTGEILKKFPQAASNGVVTVEKFATASEDRFSLPSDGLIDLYCAADIFVLPTLIETFGMVLVEAMAAGLPIVTTEAPGVKDVISHGVNGLKATPGDTAGIAELILKVLNDGELKAKLSSNSLSEAEKIYDWKAVTGKYIEFYNEIIQSKKR